MKKCIITGVLCFLAFISFGQKKAVNSAKNEIKGSSPNFTEARAQIQEAIAHPETANDAETWYIAGLIENRQFDKEKENEILGKQPNEEIMYEALQKIIPFFLKAAELDQLPDAKGKIKPKFLKDIRAIIRANRPYYINAGLFAYEKENFQKAYVNFRQFGDIPSLDIFKDEKWIIDPNDSTEIQLRFYAGLAASLIPDHQAAINIYQEIKDKGYNEFEIYQNLSNIYYQTKDSINFENIVKEGFSKFPNKEHFLINMINLSINSGKSDEAITYLEKAIEQSPDNAQLYDVLGQIYEADKQSDDAILNMKKALELDPDNIEFLSHLGRVYFNLGVEKRVLADENSDLNKSKALTQESLDYFKYSMPYFEKVFEFEGTNIGAIYALRSIYYNLGMEDQYNKMDALYSKEEE